MFVSINDIKIPFMYTKTPPKKSTIERHNAYFIEHKSIPHIIILDRKFILRDGYADYLIAKEAGIDKLDCIIDYDFAISKNQRIRKTLYKNQDGKCAICGRPLQIINNSNDDYMTIDHVIPVSLGGKTQLDNLQGACTQCNEEKGNRVNRNEYINYIQKAYSEDELRILLSVVRKKNVSLCW